jgi:YD repeat-containing protein
MVEARTGSTKISYFDRRGFETKEIEDGEGRTLWKYDARGRVTEMTMWFNRTFVSRAVYTYDLEQRRVTVETYLFGLDKPSTREVSIFDSRWNEVRKETERFDYDESQQPTRDVVVYNLTYDSKGRVTASSISNEQGALRYKSMEEYDDSNRLIKSINYQYDAATATPITKSIGTYEKGGLRRTYSQYNSGGQLLMRETRTRELDEHGNWITERQATTLYDQSPQLSFTLIKRRRITFY